MKYLSVIKHIANVLGCAILFASYFALIGFAVYITENAWPMLALLLAPSCKIENEENN